MPKKRAKNKLTAMEARYVNEIIKGTPTVKAAIKAGYSKKSAAKTSYSLSKRKKIIEAIEKGQDTSLRLAEVDGSEVIRRLDEISNADIRDLFDKNEKWKTVSPDKLPDRIARCVSSVKVIHNYATGDVSYEYKLESRMEAYKLLTNIFKLVKKDEKEGELEKIRSITDLVKMSAKLGRESVEGKKTPVILEVKA